jgi:hypothetical protein
MIMYPIDTMDLVNYFHCDATYLAYINIINVFFWTQSEVNDVFHVMEKFILLSKVGLPRVEQKLPYYSH